MEAFREMVRGWLGKTLLFLLMVPFAIVGIESYFSGGGKKAAAVVNGTDVLLIDLDKKVEQQRQQLLAQLGPNNPATQDVARIRKEALNGMITQELLAQQARKQGFRVSDATVNKLIREVPAFQENGQFSQKRYEQMLQQIGESPATYPTRAKQELAYSMLVAGVVQSGVVTTPELERLSSLDNQKRDIHYTAVPAARYLSEVSATADEVKKYYGDHADRFTAPESVAIDYITLRREDFLAAATPSEEDLQARYDEKVKAGSANEQRQAQHILITVDAKTKDADALKKIQDVEKRARAGEDFAKLAKEFSQDPGSVAKGGDLGLAGRGMFVPEFEKALFSLKEGEISAPVKTQYGYHLIKLNRVVKPETPSFAALKPQLEKEAKEIKADELFSDSVDKLDTAVYEASDLKEPAEKFGRPVASTGSFTRSGGAGPAADHKVVEAAFSDDLAKEGKNSQALHLQDGSVAWIHVRQYTPAALKPLAAVEADARNQLLLEKAHAKAATAAAAITKALNEGASLADMAAREKLAWQSNLDATRRTPGLPPEILRTAYRLPHPAEGKISADNLDTGSAYVVVAVSKVIPGVPAAVSELGQLRNVLSENRSQQEFQDYVRFLREKGKVVLKDEKKDKAGN